MQVHRCIRATKGLHVGFAIGPCQHVGLSIVTTFICSESHKNVDVDVELPVMLN